jgi:acetyl esterase/lipase
MMFNFTLRFLPILLIQLLLLTSASAQDISKYYTVMHPEKFEIDWTGFYQTNIEATLKVRKTYPHHLNLAFGSDPKQALDLYLPLGKVSEAPVFLFLHGGGFREGDRAHYGSVAEPFLKNGIITAVASYRLTGDGFHYPAQSDDVKSAIKWLYENINSYGGRADAIFAGGHSAGAILSADVGVDRAWMTEMGIPKEALRGIIPVSGPYDMRKKGRPGEQSAYAPTAALQEQASPILHINDPVPSALVAVGSVEKYQESSIAFTKGLKAAGVDANYLLMKNEDHDDTALSLANEESELFKRTIKMILTEN